MQSVSLSSQQMEAVARIRDTKGNFILAGYAGTGKTTLISHLDGVVVAYTNKACKVLKSKLVAAQTIHSLMYHVVSENPFRVVRKNRIMANRIIVDESSMVGKTLRKDLESYKVPITYIGDPFQLPPVDDGASIMLRPDFTLTEVHRHAGKIALLANAIRESKKWPHTVDRYEVDPTKYDMVICHTNKTRQRLNYDIRGHAGAPQVGDTVCVMKTNHTAGIYSGEIGIIIDTKPFLIDFDGVHRIVKTWAPYLDFGYAITAHKAQGSEYGSVLVIDERNKYVNANWIYTAVTRAKERVDIAG